MKIVIRAGAGNHGTATIWVAQAAAEIVNCDIRKPPSPFRYARIEGLALAAATGSGAQTARAIGDDALVADGSSIGEAVVAKPEFVHHCGTGGPNPVPYGRQRADIKSAPEQWIHSGVILASRCIIAGPEHPTDPVLAVDDVVNFPNPIVAAIDVGECRGVADTICIGVRDEAARARYGCQGAAKQIPAYGTQRHAGALHRLHRVHHAVRRIRGCLPGGFGHWKNKYVANQVPQTLIAG